MENKPLVSIITPTYNHEKYIGKCIESVLAQTYDNWEQIIIDDGSSDDTPKIIEQYKDPRIRYIRQKNLGIWQLAKTYNRVLNLSEGDFIATLEGDDYWPENKLERQLPYFKNKKIVLSWGKGAMVDASGKTIKEISPRNFSRDQEIYQNAPPGTALKKLLLINFLIPTVTVMVRREVLMEIGGFKQPSDVPYVDFPTWLEVCLRGEFHFVNEILGYWRQHSSQATATLFAEVLLGHVKTSVQFYQNLSEDQKHFYGLKDNLVMSRNYWVQGRAQLVKREWRQAARGFIKVLWLGSVSLKLKSIVGLIFAFFHSDLEKIAKLRKPQY